MNLEKQKECFKDHLAAFTDYGNIKILDFKNPKSSNYRIRFLFEEDYCRLHISGDLGELIATNYDNMTYEKFSDFVDDVEYFEQKINCCSRPVYCYDAGDAAEDLRELFEEHEVYDEIISEKNEWETEEERIEDVIDDILRDFSDTTGIGSKGYDELSKRISDAWEIASDIGKKSTGILGLYMLAFKLATEQLQGRKEVTNGVSKGKV